MSSGLRLTVVVGLLLVVIILVVHPLLDLEPTVLRSLQTSGLLLVLFIFHNISGHTKLPLGCTLIVPKTLLPSVRIVRLSSISFVLGSAKARFFFQNKLLALQLNVDCADSLSCTSDVVIEQ